nr:EndoU domain-containing protein [uncultured Massilia sp.]
MKRGGALINEIIGAHSGEIDNSNVKYAVQVLTEYSDGTSKVKLVAQFDDGNVSKIKTSTLFPKAWSRQNIMDAIKVIADMKPVVTCARDGTS